MQSIKKSRSLGQIGVKVLKNAKSSVKESFGYNCHENKPAVLAAISSNGKDRKHIANNIKKVKEKGLNS